jgi:hypothetical protein
MTATCGGTSSPDDSLAAQTRANVQGSFVLVRAGGDPPGAVCFEQVDPPKGSMVVFGMLTFDTERSVVRQIEVRRNDCSSVPLNDTVKVDQERPIRIIGPNVLVDRPLTREGALTDTVRSSGATLVARRHGADFVYERIVRSDNAFYALSSDIGSWMAGVGLFAPGNAERTSWGLQLEPTHFAINQHLAFARLTGRPTAGTYQLGGSSTSFYAAMERDIPTGAQFFESVSGTIVITDSSPDRVSGSFTLDMVDTRGTTNRVDGKFTARCSLRAGCP